MWAADSIFQEIDSRVNEEREHSGKETVLVRFHSCIQIPDINFKALYCPNDLIIIGAIGFSRTQKMEA